MLMSLLSNGEEELSFMDFMCQIAAFTSFSRKVCQEMEQKRQ